MTTKINANAGTGLTETIDTSGILELQTANTTAVIIGTDQNANFTSTGAITLPSGTNAQRPSSAVNGMLRYNTTGRNFEAYLNGAWTAVTNAAPYTVTYLVVGGGAGATAGTSGVNYGAGGGGGILRTGTLSFTVGTSYTATVGAGGTGIRIGTAGNGGSSSITGGTTATGGNGVSNSSGTGGSNADYAGGAGVGTYPGGGGAGAGQAGGPGSTNNGGNGAVSSITGTAVYYGGGGGGANQAGAATGGLGGGGNGGQGSGVAGTANTGGGAGGSGDPFFVNGGSGIVILSIPTVSYSGTYTGSNVAVTTSGSNTIVSFYSSGTYTG